MVVTELYTTLSQIPTPVAGASRRSVFNGDSNRRICNIYYTDVVDDDLS